MAGVTERTPPGTATRGVSSPTARSVTRRRVPHAVRRVKALPVAECLSETTVVGLARGDLSAAHAAQARAHIDTCNACLARDAELCGEALTGDGTHASRAAPPLAETGHAIAWVVPNE